MKSPLPERAKQEGGSFVVSIIIHGVVILALATLTFRYPLSAFLHDQQTRPEALHYVVTAPPGQVGNGSRTPQAAKRAPTAPAPLVAPRTIPNAVPAPPAPSSSQGAVSGKAGGKGGAAVGVATGVEPSPPDPRLYAPPIFVPVPKTNAQRVDSAVQAAFGLYLDSVTIAAAHEGRKPGDWTFEKNGQKYGWDPSGIHLGKFTIPNAVLAALPLRIGNGGVSPVDQRTQAFIRQDVMDHAQQAVTEDEFRDAVRRIRERKDREKREQEKAKDKAPTRAIADSTRVLP